MNVTLLFCLSEEGSCLAYVEVELGGVMELK